MIQFVSSLFRRLPLTLIVIASIVMDNSTEDIINYINVDFRPTPSVIVARSMTYAARAFQIVYFNLEALSKYLSYHVLCVCVLWKALVFDTCFMGYCKVFVEVSWFFVSFVYSMSVFSSFFDTLLWRQVKLAGNQLRNLQLFQFHLFFTLFFSDV